MRVILIICNVYSGRGSDGIDLCGCNATWKVCHTSTYQHNQHTTTATGTGPADGVSRARLAQSVISGQDRSRVRRRDTEIPVIRNMLTEGPVLTTISYYNQGSLHLRRCEQFVCVMLMVGG